MTILCEVVELQKIDPGQNMDKFYRTYVTSDGEYLTHWGKNGSIGQLHRDGVVELGRQAAVEASKVRSEKLADGYWMVRVATFQVVAGGLKGYTRDMLNRIVADFPDNLTAPEPEPEDTSEIEDEMLATLLRIAAIDEPVPDRPPTIEDRLAAALKKAQSEPI